jgi:hypothetical protein
VSTIEQSAEDDIRAEDEEHLRPEGVDDATVAAVGKLSEAVEWLERARGRLYDFHQMLGHLDFQMSDAAVLLREAGHAELAGLVESDIIGRNVLDGRWTYQILEEFEDVYYDVIRETERRIRGELLAGRRHIFEAEMKARRRSVGRTGHEQLPLAAHDPRVPTTNHHQANPSTRR